MRNFNEIFTAILDISFLTGHVNHEVKINYPQLGIKIISWWLALLLHANAKYRRPTTQVQVWLNTTCRQLSSPMCTCDQAGPSRCFNVVTSAIVSNFIDNESVQVKFIPVVNRVNV